MRTLYRILSVVTLSALISGPVLLAQEDRQYDPPTDDQATVAESGQSAQTDQPMQSDAPARAARLQYMSGSVSVQPQGTGDWAAGQLNRPLTNADNIWADKNSRAEISVGTGLIRIDSESSLTLTNVSENMVQLQLHQGAMNLHVRRLYDNETYEVDTPNQAFTVRKPGDYRFDVDPDKDKTVITVWRGEGESTGNGPAVRIRENEQARFTNGTSMTNDIHGAPSPDAFDEWAQARDGRFDHSNSARYVSPGVVGSEDLDEYGTWRDTSQYGNVWVPSGVGVGWSPYRYGHWIWVGPWGWTWVEDEPWGYAPFHYGRWVYYDNYWGWAPGPIYVRPYYSPALVAWFGGPGWGASFGFGFGFGGGIGWCPLGFGEPFIPWYGASFGYFNRVNITNTRITNVNITNIYKNTFVNNHPVKGGDPGRVGHHGDQIRYANMHAPNGFTAVSRNTLVNSQNVARNAVRISPNEMNKVSPVHNIDARPTRTTMFGSNGRAAVVPPQRSFARPVVSHATPPAGGGFNRPSPAVGLGRNQGAGSEMRGVQNPAANISNHGAGPNGANRNVRMPDLRPMSVPRPPNAGGSSSERGMNSGGAGNPRSNVAMPTARPESQGRAAPEMASRSNVPRPPAASVYRGEGASGGAPRSERPSNSVPRGESGNSHGSSSRGGSGPRSEIRVPRPSEASATRGYSSAGERQSFPSADNQRSQSSRPAPSYEANNRPNYGGGSYDRPVYGGGSYSRPAPSYDRGSSARSMPSYGGSSYSRPTPSYGGGGGRVQSYGGGGFGGGRAPSYGGGGGFGGGHAPSYGGGGGGHASAPSHSSGGGGGARSSSSGHGHH